MDSTLTNKLKKISSIKKQLKGVLSGAYGEEQVKPLKFEQFPGKFKAMSDERSYLSVNVEERLVELSGKTDELSGKTNILSARTSALENDVGVEYIDEFEDITDKIETINKWLDVNGSLSDNNGKTTSLISKEQAEDLYFTGSSDPYGNPVIVVAYGPDEKIIQTPDGKPASYGLNTKLFRFPLSEESILKITGGSPYSYIRASSYNVPHFKLERRVKSERILAKQILDGYPCVETELDFPFDNEYLSRLEFTDWTNKYPWNVRNGGTMESDWWKTTDFIPVTRDSKFLVTGYAQWATTIFNFYSFDKKPLYVPGYEGYNVSDPNAAYYLKDYQLDISAVMEINQTVLSNIAYVRFCGGTPQADHADYACRVLELKRPDTGDAVLDLAKKLQDMSNSNGIGNVLFNKKYVSIGDSFTSPTYSYANIIAARNQMQFINLGVGGSCIGYFKTSNFDDSDAPEDIRSVFSYRIDTLEEMLSSMEYVTIQYGLNELNLTTQQIGEKTDAGGLNVNRHTLWGAWNYVLKKLLTWNPLMKIGIILSDSWLSEQQRTTQLEIGKYWGIPCLDFKGDSSVPMLTGGKTWETCEIARQLRNAAFTVSEADSHPNEAGHAYRSTIVENFMRSL